MRPPTRHCYRRAKARWASANDDRIEDNRGLHGWNAAAHPCGAACRAWRAGQGEPVTGYLLVPTDDPHHVLSRGSVLPRRGVLGLGHP